MSTLLYWMFIAVGIVAAIAIGYILYSLVRKDKRSKEIEDKEILAELSRVVNNLTEIAWEQSSRIHELEEVLAASVPHLVNDRSFGIVTLENRKTIKAFLRKRGEKI